MKDLKMDNFKQRQGQSAATRLTPVAMACSVLLFSAGAAFAQQAQQLEQVTVTGLRSSIETSIATKRNSDSIVEAVSSEDIGKLPETSIAESLEVHSDALRTKRRLIAEEAAAKLPIKLLIPLIFCVFPALMTVLLGPVVISITQHLFPLVNN